MRSTQILNVPYHTAILAAERSTNTTSTFFFAKKYFRLLAFKATWSTVNLLRQKPNCPRGSRGSMVGSMRARMILEGMQSKEIRRTVFSILQWFVLRKNCNYQGGPPNFGKFELANTERKKNLKNQVSKEYELRAKMVWAWCFAMLQQRTQLGRRPARQTLQRVGILQNSNIFSLQSLLTRDLLFCTLYFLLIGRRWR